MAKQSKQKAQYQMKNDIFSNLEQWALRDYRESVDAARRMYYDPKRKPKVMWASAWVVLASANEDLFRRLGDMTIKRHSNKEFTFDRWVNVRLEEQHKEELAHLADNVQPKDLIEWLGVMAFEGYSFSASWDEYSDAVQVSLVCKAPDDPNYGLGMSARHPDFDLAVLTLQYKHEQLCDSNWSAQPPSPKGTAWG